MNRLVDLVVDRGLLPDTLLRTLIRLLLRRRRAHISRGTRDAHVARDRALIRALSSAPVALATAEANEQHYEVPAAFFEVMLGPRLKYSSGWWSDEIDTLARAEDAMLDLTCRRADLEDGQDVLDLGCGWGSFTLYAAERFPASRFTAVSNSATQRTWIERQARARGLDNVTVRTDDANTLEFPAAAFDRVVSIEMFEHVRNHRMLTEKISRWLRPRGVLFVHVFVHREHAYSFETNGSADWMARHFFTGGLMPSYDLLPRVVTALDLDDRWVVSGRHYARTLRAWLERLDAHRDELVHVLANGGDPNQGQVRLRRWRVFTMACEELFAFGGGGEWHVAHYRFVKPRD